MTMQRILSVAAPFWMNEKCVFYWIVLNLLNVKYIYLVFEQRSVFYRRHSFLYSFI